MSQRRRVNEVLAKPGAPVHVKELLVGNATVMKLIRNQTREGSDEPDRT